MRSRPFASRVAAWQRRHGRNDLPWQSSRDPYRIWLSEIMLQQTQVATVLPYYERFLAAFPDVASLARAPIGRVLELWAGLGYYRRAHHLHAAARVVAEQHGGTFPSDPHALAALPGVGRSTAAAIAAFAFGVCGAILDGNVKRVLARHRGIEGSPGEAAVERRLWDAAEALLPARGIERYTQGLMDLGATVCTRTAPRCEACPVASDCVARREGCIDRLPSPQPRRSLPHRETRVLLIERGSHLDGEYRIASVRPGTVRIPVLWTRIRTPNGVTVDVESPGTGQLGQSGIDGYVDNRWGERIGAAMLLSLIDDSVKLVIQNQASDRQADTIVLPSTTANTSKLAEKVLDSTINIPPLIYQNQGGIVGIYVARDVDFSSVYELKPTAGELPREGAR